MLIPGLLRYADKLHPNTLLDTVITDRVKKTFWNFVVHLLRKINPWQDIPTEIDMVDNTLIRLSHKTRNENHIPRLVLEFLNHF